MGYQRGFGGVTPNTLYSHKKENESHDLAFYFTSLCAANDYPQLTLHPSTSTYTCDYAIPTGGVILNIIEGFVKPDF